MFVEAEFPKTIAAKAMGGPAFNTTVNEGFSGFEQRNQNWQTVRGEWNITLNTPSSAFVANPQTFIDQLTAFFLIVGGKANGFRLKDHKDFTNGSGAQFVAVGDGNTSIFQLLKAYTSAGRQYTRIIYKPVTSLVVDYLGAPLADSVNIFVGGVPQAKNAGYVGGGTAQYTIDETLGTICFRGVSQWALTAVSVSGGVATYSYTVVSGNAPQKNQQATITAMTHAANNGAFNITAVSPASATTGTFTVNNALAVVESGSSGVGQVFVSQISITAATQSGSNTTYSYTLLSGQPVSANMRVLITGMGDAGNNGTFYVSSTGAGTFTVPNPSGVTRTLQAGTGLSDWTPASTAIITSTFDFHFPVRFDTDKLAIQLEPSDVEGGEPIITWNTILLRELRLTAGQG